MNLTKFGKFTRKLRIDRGELLKDMAEKLNCKPSFLSNVELGRRKVPAAWRSIILVKYKLSYNEFLELSNAINGEDEING